MGNPKVQKEILDAVDIIVKKRLENVPQILFGIVTEILDNNKCNVTINMIGHQAKYYGDAPPTLNKKYPVFVPSSGMSQAFIITDIGSSGAVSTVAGVSPDANGNVALTASDVEALPVAGGSMEGAINMNGYSISGLNNPTGESQAARKGYVDAAVRKAVFRNLLDNSDFRTPVNQRGKTSYSGSGYTIDRWLNNSNACKLSVENGCIHMQNNTASTSTATQYIYQKIENIEKLRGKTFTAAAKARGTSVRLNANNAVTGAYESYNDFAVITLQFTIPEDATEYFIGLQGINKSEWYCEWIALYEGQYTAETLPEYQSKGYGAELMECQRYYQIRSTNNIAAVDMRPTMRSTNLTITSVTGGYAYSADL